MGVNTLCNDRGQDHVRMVSSSRVFSVCSLEWPSQVIQNTIPSDERRRHRREMQSPAIAFKIHIFVIWQFNLFLWQKQERNSQTKVMKVPVTINLTPSHRIHPGYIYYATMLLQWVDTLTIKESTYRMNGSLTMDVADYIYPSINHSFIQKVWLCDVWHIEDIKQNMVS